MPARIDISKRSQRSTLRNEAKAQPCETSLRLDRNEPTDPCETKPRLSRTKRSQASIVRNEASAASCETREMARGWRIRAYRGFRANSSSIKAYGITSG